MVRGKITLQVGGGDFSLDLLFFHRGASCLVAFELKLDEFQPEHLGKLGFYLEALDRDVKKPHENPSIGVLTEVRREISALGLELNQATAKLARKLSTKR